MHVLSSFRHPTLLHFHHHDSHSTLLGADLSSNPSSSPPLIATRSGCLKLVLGCPGIRGLYLESDHRLLRTKMEGR